MSRGGLQVATPAVRLRHRADRWCIRLKVTPRQLRVQPMRHKWGSCSTLGTLAVDLDEQSQEFQDYVIVHELLHLKVKNHGKLFKALLSVHLPNWRELRTPLKKVLPPPFPTPT